jgi:hypothetical protein
VLGGGNYIVQDAVSRQDLQRSRLQQGGAGLSVRRAGALDDPHLRPVPGKRERREQS